jgi:signal transduction histidine kinase
VTFLLFQKQLAEANGGSLRLEHSEPGIGTAFALNLPLVKPKPVKETAHT